MKTKTLRQSVTLKASPDEVYELLMDSKKNSKLTGSKSVISTEVGGRFSMMDYVDGWNEELISGKKIVQKWRGNDWPEGHHSTVAIELKKLPSGTGLTLTQTGVPEDQFKHLKEGWTEYYWDKMAKSFERDASRPKRRG